MNLLRSLLPIGTLLLAAGVSCARMKRHESRRLSLLSVISVILLTFPVGCGQADRLDASDPFASAKTRIHRLMEKQKIASFQVAVARDGKIIYEESFGWANVQQKIPTTTQTMHLLASIDKPFTSTALMILAERGKIDLHGPVNAYLGEAKLIAYRGNAAEATVARMMLHTSGLPCGYYRTLALRPSSTVAAALAFTTGST